MFIVGCDYHPSWQQVAWFDNETAEVGEQKLVNGNGEAERWYRQLPAPALIGLEATGNSQWFVEMLQYQHRCHSKPKGVAKVAAARRLAVRLYWMLRTQT